MLHEACEAARCHEDVSEAASGDPSSGGPRPYPSEADATIGSLHVEIGTNGSALLTARCWVVEIGCDRDHHRAAVDWLEWERMNDFRHMRTDFKRLTGLLSTWSACRSVALQGVTPLPSTASALLHARFRGIDFGLAKINTPGNQRLRRSVLEKFFALGQPLTVLAVDDNDIKRDLAKSVLEPGGYAVSCLPLRHGSHHRPYRRWVSRSQTGPRCCWYQRLRGEAATPHDPFR